MYQINNIILKVIKDEYGEIFDKLLIDYLKEEATIKDNNTIEIKIPDVEIVQELVEIRRKLDNTK